jgi:F420H(2)-dependent quinone reductase
MKTGGQGYGTRRIEPIEAPGGSADCDLDALRSQVRQPYEVTIWFVLGDEKFYISTANVNREWVRNVQKTPHIRLSIGGETFEGTARILADRAEHERAMAAIRRKYWMYSPIMALGRILTAMRVMRDNTGSFEVTLAG